MQPRDLLDKYLEMRALRTLDAEGKLSNPKPRMRALAEQFPGALREIDELSLEVIQSRISALEKLGDRTPEPWMIAMARFHAAMREVLAIKRVLGRKKITPALRRAAERAAPGSAWDLDRVARPPAGRLTDVVFRKIAEEMRITTKRARDLVFAPKMK